MSLAKTFAIVFALTLMGFSTQGAVLVGSLPGEITVSNSGEANYSIPIEVPPGTAGMQPSLSLVYSSNGGVGMLGIGWSMSGLSAITRGPTMFGRDGFIDAADFDANDKFYLDGQRLIHVAEGTDPMGAFDEFRTEIESFSKIRCYGGDVSSNNGLQATNPAKFVVETKAGLILTFGDVSISPWSRQAIGSQSPSAWAVSRIEDTLGNYMQFYYTDPNSSGVGPIPSGSIGINISSIDRIEYSGKLGAGSFSPYLCVKFVYEDRPYLEWSKGYSRGSIVSLTKRLSSIYVIDQSAHGSFTPGSQNFHLRYDITYCDEVGAFESCGLIGRSRIDSVGVTKTRRDASGSVVSADSFPRTQFKYADDPEVATTVEEYFTRDFGSWGDSDYLSEPQFLVLDLNDDGHPEIARLTTRRTNDFYATCDVLMEVQRVRPDGGLEQNLMNFDFQGVGDSGPANVIEAELSSPMDDAVPLVSALNGKSIFAGDCASYFRALTGDFNGDGRSDIMLVHLVRVHYDSNLSGNSNYWIKIFRLYLNTGSGLEYAGQSAGGPSKVLGEGHAEYGYGLDHFLMENHVVDYDSDGVSELVRLKFNVNNNNFTWKVWESSNPAAGGILDTFIGETTVSASGFTISDLNKLQPSFADFNADGVADIMIEARADDGKHRLFGFYGSSILGSSMQTPSVSYPGLGINLELASLWDENASVQFVDLNADGYADVVSSSKGKNNDGRDSRLFSYWISKGNSTFSYKATINDLYSYCGPGDRSWTWEEDAPWFFSDIDQNGWLDLVYYSKHTPYFSSSQCTKRYLSYISFNVHTQTFGVVWNRIECDIGPTKQQLSLIDLNNDSAPELLGIEKDKYRFTSLYSYSGTPQPRDTIVRVINGLGAVSRVMYAPLTKPVVDGAGWEMTTSGGYQSAIYSKGSQMQYPLVDVIGPMWVAEWSGVENGGLVNGSPDSVWTQYVYADGIADMHGRGFLGFGAFTSFMWQKDSTTGGFTSGMLKTQKLWTAFPKTGMEIESRGEYHWENEYGSWDGVILSLSQDTVIADAVAAPTTPPSSDQKLWSLYPMVTKSRRQVWEMNLDPQTGAPSQGAQYGDTATYTWFDGMAFGSEGSTLPPLADFPSTSTVYGNITGVRVEFEPTSWTFTSNAYGSSVDDQRYGRLSAASVTHKVGTSQKEVRSSSFTYYGGSGLLHTETVDVPDGLSLVTTYSYDSYGNIEQKTVTGAFGAGASDNTSFAQVTGQVVEAVCDDSWDTYHRWATKRKNSVGDVESYTYQAPFGEVLTQSGPNGVTTRWEYDAFGRVVKEIRPDGTETITSRASTNPVTVPVPSALASSGLSLTSAYSVTTTSTQSPQSIVYYDRSNRQIRASSQSLNTGDSRWVIQDTIYGHHGEVLGTSENYFSDNPSSAKWTITSYDGLMRASTVTLPNGATVTNIYNGLESTVKKTHGGKTQVSKVVKNRKGELVESYNPDPASAGATILGVKHYYTASGNLDYTQPQNQAAQKVDFSYDGRGNKIAMIDPDMGSWTYVYDALGRLRRQVDAVNNVTLMDYDDLGRLIVRKIKNGSAIEEVTHFYYYEPVGDLRPENGWVGALAREVVFQAGIDPEYGNYPDSTVRYQKGYYYDHLGRKFLDLYFIDNKWYYTYSRFDGYGRPTRVDHFWRPKGMEGDYSESPHVWHSYGVGYSYNDRSAVTDVFDSTGRNWWNSPNYDQQGRLESYRNGQTLVYTQNVFDPLDHTISSVKSGYTIGGTEFQDLSFDFDGYGNLIHRNVKWQEGSTVVNNTEAFGFDGSNRLLSVERWVGSSYTNDPLITYTTNGNLLSKNGYTLGGYGSGAGIHAVTSVTGPGGVSLNIGYDANGRMNYRRHQLNGVTQNQWCFNWTGFGKPSSIFDGFDGHEFQYDASHSRIVHTRLGDGTTGNRTDCTFAQLEKRVYVGGAMEQFFTKSGSTWSAAKTRIYVSGPSGVIGVFNHDANATSAASNTASWLLKDHLGSVDTVLTMVGTQVQAQRYSYDAWGQRRDAVTWAVQDPATISSTATDRGFTGHEMLDATGLVHMNGRIYDPLLGRFLSADPHVQSPQDLQSYNRYTYVNNNPVSFTDSTGFFIDKLFKKVGNFFKKYWKVIVAIAVTVVTAGMAAWAMVGSFSAAFTGVGVGFWAGVGIGAAAGFAGGFTMGLLSGGGLSAALQGGAWGALSGSLAGAVGGYFGPTGGTEHELTRALAHGLSQGSVTELQGGDFAAGFLAGAFSSAAMHIGKQPQNYFIKLAKAAIVGGTASRVGGGKFENGAVSGAFTFMFNQALHRKPVFFEGGEVDIDNPRTEKELQDAVGWEQGRTVVFTGKRALGGVIRAGTYGMDGSNTEILHEQVFWIDASGKVNNSGFFSGSGVRPDDATRYSFSDYSFKGKVMHTYGDYSHYIQRAVDYAKIRKFSTSRYDLFEWNCQDYADYIRGVVDMPLPGSAFTRWAE